MKKLFYLPAVLMFFAGIFAACTETHEEPVRIDVSQEDLAQEFPSAASKRFVSVTANKLFDLKSSAESWCKISRTSNEHRVTGITIVVDENLKPEIRNAEITVWTGDLEPVVIQVIQNAADPFIIVAEKSLVIKNNLSIDLHIETNLEVDFDLPAWIKRGETDAEAGIYGVEIDALGANAPRDGAIVVKAKTITGVTPVTIPVRQEEPVILPTPPQIPAEKYVAVWSDLTFTPEGYLNRAKGKGDKVPVRIITGSAGAPASVWSDELNSYVASYPTVNPDKFYTALYCDLDGFKADGYAIEGGSGEGCSMEFLLKVTNTGNGARIRPMGSFEVLNGNFGIGLEIDDADHFAFKVANGGGSWNTPHLAPDNDMWDKTKWYHFLFVYNKPNNKISLFIDGVRACDDRAFNANTGNKWVTLPWQDKHRGMGLGGNYRGLYNNEAPKPGTNKMLLDGMTGEFAFFRWYGGDTHYTDADAAARYAGIKARMVSDKFALMKTMITQTLPEKSATGISTDLKNAIDSAIEMGWGLMGNFETSEATATAFLNYADELLNFE